MLGYMRSVLTSPYFYFALSAIVLLFATTRKNNNFFDVQHIIKSHLNIFKDSKFQYVIFYGVPFLLSTGTLLQQFVNEDLLGHIIIVISIFMSMLFAMLSTITSLNQKTKDEFYLKLVNETHMSILFEAILCIGVLIISFTLLFSNITNCFVLGIFSFILYYLIYTIMLQVFILVKRISVLLREQSTK